MNGNKTHISGVGRVIVPVSDQDRALEFYLQTLGMEKRTDAPAAGGDRWIEVAPAGETTVLGLIRPRGGMYGHPGGDTRITSQAPTSTPITPRCAKPASTWTR